MPFSCKAVAPSVQALREAHIIRPNGLINQFSPDSAWAHLTTEFENEMSEARWTTIRDRIFLMRLVSFGVLTIEFLVLLFSLYLVHLRWVLGVLLAFAVGLFEVFRQDYFSPLQSFIKDKPHWPEVAPWIFKILPERVKNHPTLLDYFCAQLAERLGIFREINYRRCFRKSI